MMALSSSCWARCCEAASSVMSQQQQRRNSICTLSRSVPSPQSQPLMHFTVRGSGLTADVHVYRSTCTQVHTYLKTLIPWWANTATFLWHPQLTSKWAWTLVCLLWGNDWDRQMRGMAVTAHQGVHGRTAGRYKTFKHLSSIPGWLKEAGWGPGCILLFCDLVFLLLPLDFLNKTWFFAVLWTMGLPWEWYINVMCITTHC